MDKKKVLHALRSLEMTLEQKQEFIDAIAESDSAGGKKVTIDVTDLATKEANSRDLTNEEYEAILNRNCEFIVNDGDNIFPLIMISINYYSITLSSFEDNYRINLHISHDPKRLVIITPK